MFVVYEVYKIDEPEKNYIGKTSKDKVKNGYLGSGTIIRNAIKQHGRELFDIKILVEVEDENEVYKLEEKLIEERNPHYNISPGGRGTGSGEKCVWYGRKHTEETIEKMKNDGRRGRKYTVETKKRMGRPKGSKDSLETRQKKSVARQGSKNPMWGKKRPDMIEVAKRNRKPIEDKRLYEMREQGMYFRDIGTAVGLSASNVYERLRKYNG